ncbi:nuclear transport factor 2 family protein [Nocardia farcinica]|uniref:nuclear transport factor 2 family protein n=1 Tax=Nocardia farcinica TaxID=37329 RepID=UPI002455828C|nr:nuclear transport factor 2 family protein [Nocardia farcinica]
MSFPSEIVDRLAITDVLTRLFVYTDEKRWDDLLDLFAAEVDFDGGTGQAQRRPATDIAADWKAALEPLDAVHHQAGNYLVDLDGDRADVHADSIAVHVREDATQGKTRTFIGSYRLGVHRDGAGWRIDRFHYRPKVIEGNVDLT